jgi:putative transposase
MARSYAPEFRRRVVELVRAGRSVAVVSSEIGVSEATVYRWRAQDRIDRGERPGLSSVERSELAQARRRIRELESELEIAKKASALFAAGEVSPKGNPVIASLAGQGFEIKRCCRILGAAPSGYFSWRRRSPSPSELRREWLRGLISQIHADSRGVYGYRRVRAELRLGRQIMVSRKLVHKLMAEERLKGLPTRKQRRTLVNVATAEDLVCRDFAREAPDQLWLTDITEHPTTEGKVYCCVVLDAHSRRIVGWSIDTHQATSLVTNALAMAISNRTPPPGTVIHCDHGSQFTSWAFSERVRRAGLVPSMGTVGDAFATMPSSRPSWARLQTELLDRKEWKTRIELSTALFDYLDIFHNRNRRHSALGMLTPIEFEKVNNETANAA